MKNIGGFIGLQLERGTSSYHKDALALSTGRGCLRYIVENSKPKKVYIPFFGCGVIEQTLRRMKILYEKYPIDSQLEISRNIALKRKELILYINYFGVKDSYCDTLSNQYGEGLIIDNSQAFFNKGYKKSFSFNSARKFFGVPDGAYVYNTPRSKERLLKRNNAVSLDHLVDRLNGNDAIAFKKFQAYEQHINYSVKRISLISERLLSNTGYGKNASTRRGNFRYYHSRLSSINKLRLSLGQRSVPLAYPFLANKMVDFRKLHAKGYFIPVYWPELRLSRQKKFNFEKELTGKLLALPIDHRYGNVEIQMVINAIRKFVV